MLIFFQTSLKLLSKDVADFADSLESNLECFVGVDGGVFGDLDANVADRLAGVRHRVGNEFDLLVFDQLVAEEIAKCVVFIAERVRRVLAVVTSCALDCQFLLSSAKIVRVKTF